MHGSHEDKQVTTPVGLGPGLLSALLAAWLAAAATGQGTPAGSVEISGDRLGGFVIPMLPVESEIVLEAQRARNWNVADTTRMLLEGDVRIDVGGYAFSASNALVWIDRIPSELGLVNQLAVYFPEVEEPTRRAGLGVTGKDVLVVGSALGKVTLRTSIRVEGPAPISELLRAGERRLAVYLRQITGNPPPLKMRPQAFTPRRPPLPTPVPGGSPLIPDPEAEELARLPRAIPLPTEVIESVPIFQPSGLVSFTANEIEIREDTDTIVADGRFLVDYNPMGSNDAFAPLQMNANGGVIFLEEGTVASLRGGESQVSIEDVRGIYLEQDVSATDGRYAVRAQAIYYDTRTNQALMVDAVLRTYDRDRRDRPLFARAKEMRQLSAEEWQAERAMISTSSFFVPQLSIGLDRVRITRQPGVADTGLGGGGSGTGPGTGSGEGAGATRIEGENLTMRAGGVPFFYWPSFSGELDALPFRSLRVGYDEEFGSEIETTWNLLALLGIKSPPDTRVDLLLDGFTKRGPAAGIDFSSDGVDYRTRLSAYGLYDGGGTDRTSAGVSVPVSESFRGELEGFFTYALAENLTFRADLAWLSDPTWASAWRLGEFDTRLEYMTGASLDFRVKNTQLELAANYSAIPFVANNYKMASRPYYVDKAPELVYRRHADTLFGDSVSYSSNYSASYMRIDVTNGTPDDLGVPSAAFAMTDPDQRVADNYYGAAGYNNDFVTRLNTRQEASVPLTYGATNLVPYVSGQATGYISERFDSYNPDAKHIRFFGAIGFKANTTFVETFNQVRSSILDIDRVRSITRPYAHLWAGADSINQEGLPIFDQEIEAISGGSAVRAGVRQTFQTKRGGGSRRQSVDWLDLDVGAQLNDAANVFTAADARTPWNYAQSPTPSWVDWRPELSQWGSHLYGNLDWELSDTFSIGGSTTYLVDTVTGVEIQSDGTQTRKDYDGLMTGSVGFEVEHSPAMSTYLEYRYIQPGETELVQGGVAYQLGKRYQIGITPQYDLKANDLRSINGVLTRTFSDFELTLQGGFDVIRDSPTFSVRFALPPQAN